MIRSGLFALLLVALVGCSGGGGSGAASLPYPVQQSWTKLPFANGYGAGIYDASFAHKVAGFRTPMFARIDAANETKDFCYDVYFGVRQGTTGKWLNTVAERDVAYVPGTGIVRTVQRVGGIRFESFYFAPMAPQSGAERSLVMIVHAVNEGAALSDVALYALLNFHTGGGASPITEFAWRPAADHFIEGGNSGTAGQTTRLVHKALGTVTHASAGGSGTTAANNPLTLLDGGLPLNDQPAVGAALNDSDMACGFESAVAGGGNFATGTGAWFGVAIALDERTTWDTNAELAFRDAVNTWVGTRTPERILDDEIVWWSAFHASETLPPRISAADLALYRQSTAVLKMAQVRVPGGGTGDGQILASLPPGGWNIGWVRDGCYAIAALARSGHVEEAKKGLQFFLNSGPGQFTDAQYVGRSYRISVCRYYGNGDEWSDSNAAGPNVEFDGFGLFLWALKTTVDADTAGGAAFLQSNWATVANEVADVLVALVSGGLVKADSSIWERHWNAVSGTPDGRKRFTYTALTAWRGLLAAADLANARGDGRETTYRQTAAAIETALQVQFILGGVVVSSLDDLPLGIGRAVDGATVEAVNFGLYGADSAAGAATLAAFDAYLKPASWRAYSPGYRRSDDYLDYSPADAYDLREWVFVDLRIAAALSKNAARRGDARLLLDWVRAQAGANYGLIPELLTEQSARYEGAVPMVGFGAGAWVLALDDYYR